MAAIPLEKQPVEYPTSDGKPMAETTLHRVVMQDLIHGLESHFRAVPDIWVGGNLFLCYQEGNPDAALAPDVLFARGVPKYPRDNYLLWQERPPSLIVEVTSRSTKREDLGKKKEIYQRIGIEEYVLFDPYGEYLKPRLQGYRLTRVGYEPVSLERDGSLLCRTTGLLLRPEGTRARLVEPGTGKPLPWPDEEAAVRQAAEERTRILEDEVARLRAELGRSRKQG
jgi:Uma2 family endonuclease